MTHPCPSCGYCPSCGRRNFGPMPLSPTPWNPPYYPWPFNPGGGTAKPTITYGPNTTGGGVYQ